METKVLDVWTARQLANHVGCSHTFISNLVRDGKLPTSPPSDGQGIEIPGGLSALARITKNNPRMMKTYLATIATLESYECAQDAPDDQLDPWTWSVVENAVECVFMALDDGFEEHAGTMLKAKTEEDLWEALQAYFYDAAYKKVFDRIDAGLNGEPVSALKPKGI